MRDGIPRARPPRVRATGASRLDAELALVLCAALIYAIVWIARASYTVGGFRYYPLLDDAMISMRYARNLASGLGLVWNAGEYVEGFSNPLWTGWMAALHLIPMPVRLVSLLVILSGSALHLVTVVFSYRITQQIGGSRRAATGAAILTAFYYPLCLWAVSGMEVPALTALTALGASSAIRLANDPGEQSWHLWAWLATGAVVRMDFVVPAIVLLAWLGVASPARRRESLIGGLVVAGTLAILVVARLWYYGEYMPNTYYLKLEGIPLAVRVIRGAMVTGDYLLYAGLPFVALALLQVHSLRKPPGLLALLFVGQLAYSVYVGGDIYEHLGGANRFVSVAVPLFFCLLALGLERATRALSLRPEFTSVSFGLLVVATLIQANAMREGVGGIETWGLLKRPLYSNMAEDLTRAAIGLRRSTDEGASFAVALAGTLPYWLNRPCIDLLGKTDREIAHQQAHLDPAIGAEQYEPGHMKWDFSHSIGKLQPDVVAQLWGDGESAQPYLGNYFIPAGGGPPWFRKDSPHVLWSTIKD